MPGTSVKKRPLSRYLKDYKHSQTHCSQCTKQLDRMALVFRGQIINKEAIAGMDQLIDDQVWLKLQNELMALCRFCSEISCNSNPEYFDIKAFKQYLFEQTEMSHSTVREYVVRLRRLDEMLSACNYPRDRIKGNSIHQRIIEDLPDAGHNNYRIALRKYDQYLAWQSQPR
ncbi:flagellar regulatory protein FliZ [Chimaeribacter arupi]|jgi:FliZ protein|uniref:Flagellar regulatory protein FliZ n=4 Tax=Yersiniaceae TaxID=1903411 RepID=A0A2N5ELT7_9GAMM|nr:MULTISPECIES: flagella biosynthesis regulatory protein FliZ [Yersiniaceae]MDU6411833.1 flagella biosynthesis regulatory protein FliZ [Yersiniaceae bacterium]MBS0967411.1 flagella biosynthesis regulatory protein FliZ [Nissabacter archeti]MDV5141501.1 flagella biosynthesis regulatory protein FliZ [Chimaeribacter arupi]PLR31504.1 flagellar regulatory protein FliZ [Chimaeribacter coloradensis]PLR34559.1 flagellar regulatory protein FliZ [Chimaeribacter arupi]